MFVGLLFLVLCNILNCQVTYYVSVNGTADVPSGCLKINPCSFGSLFIDQIEETEVEVLVSPGVYNFSQISYIIFMNAESRLTIKSDSPKTYRAREDVVELVDKVDSMNPVDVAVFMSEVVGSFELFNSKSENIEIKIEGIVFYKLQRSFLSSSYAMARFSMLNCVDFNRKPVAVPFFDFFRDILQYVDVTNCYFENRVAFSDIQMNYAQMITVTVEHSTYNYSNVLSLISYDSPVSITLDDVEAMNIWSSEKEALYCRTHSEVSLSVKNSRFSHNQLSVLSISAYRIDSVIDNCLFFDNKAITDGTVYFNVFQVQGGRRDLVSVITNSLFIHNQNDYSAAAVKYYTRQGSTFAISHSNNTFAHNFCQVSCVGGAIIIQKYMDSNGAQQLSDGNGNDPSEMSFVNSTYENNVIQSSAGSVFYIHNAMSSELTLEGCSFSRNQAGVGTNLASGGVLVLQGINTVTNIVVESCSFDHNSATSFGGCFYFNTESGEASMDFEMSVSNSLFTSNVADNDIHGNFGQAGVFYFDKPPSETSGRVSLDIDNSKFHGQFASFGGVYSSYLPERHELMYSLVVSNSDFTNNSVDFYGGAFKLSYLDYVVFLNCFFSGNEALGIGGDSEIGDSIHAFGGAIFSYKSTIFYQQSIFVENYAKESGGAIYSYNDETVSFIGTHLEKNFVEVSGGSLFFQDVVYATFDKNSKISTSEAQFGGGLCLDSFQEVRLDGSVERNNAVVGGGGLYVRDWTNIVNLTFPTVDSNSATEYGSDKSTMPHHFDDKNAKLLCEIGIDDSHSFDCVLDGIEFFDLFGGAITSVVLERYTISLSCFFGDFEEMYNITTRHVQNLRLAFHSDSLSTQNSDPKCDLYLDGSKQGDVDVILNEESNFWGVLMIPIIILVIVVFIFLVLLAFILVCDIIVHVRRRKGQEEYVKLNM